MVRIMPDSQLPVKIERVGISVRDIVAILFRRWLVITLIAAPLVIIGGVNLFGQAGSYTASARVVVELIRVDSPKWNPTGRNVDYNRELNTLIQTALTTPVARSAAAALKDSIPVFIDLDETLVWLEEPGAMAGYLLGGLDVSVVGESAILDFRFTSSAPRISMMAVGAMRSAFLDYLVHGLKNEKAVEYYEEQMVGMRTSIDSLLSVRGDILKEAGYSSLTDELKYDSGRLAKLEADLLEAEVTRRALESDYNKLIGYLKGDPREFPMGPDENRSSTLVYWNVTVAKHDDELNSILALYKEESGPVRRQRALIADSVKKLAVEERKYVRSVEMGLASLKEREVTIRSQVQEVREKNSKAPEIYRRVSLLDAELRSLNRLLDALQGKLGEVRMTQFADERVSNTMVLSDPAVVSTLTGGTTVVYFIALLIISLALGIISGFVVENLDHRVYSPSDVEENLKLQVFASVSRAE